MKNQIDAEPYPLPFVIDKTALLMIDMQRDFLELGGIGESLGNDVGLLRSTITPCTSILSVCRELGVFIVHTREGHRPDLSDAFTTKIDRGKLDLRIGDGGPMGRLLIRGERGHEIIPELKPINDEPIIDKPAHGAFYSTDLLHILRVREIKTLIVCGVTTEVCIHCTVREANDRGFECVVPADCVGSYFPEFQRVSLEMIKAQGGIFGWVSDSNRVIGALRETKKTP